MGITKRIPASNFEIIRDRIALILAVELAYQATTFSDSDLNPLTVWNSRVVPFDKEEMSSVNVNFAAGDFFAADSGQATYTYKFTIDVHAKAKTKDGGDRGDSRANWKMNKIMGLCRAILDDNIYYNLGFDPPFIWTTWCESFNIAQQPTMQEDSQNMVMGRIVFDVKVNEDVILLDSDLIAGFDTQVKMELTDKGYVYIVNDYA